MMQQQVSSLRVSTLRPRGDLDQRTEERLVTGLIAALPALKMRELFAVRRDMLREADLISVVTDGGAVAGVLSSRWCPLRSGASFLHVMTQFVGESHRHGLVFRRCWAAHFDELLRDGGRFPSLIALKTYNPVVFCAMRAFTLAPGTVMYPSIDGDGQAADQARLAAEVAGVVAPGYPFDAAIGVIHGAGVPVDFYPAIPASRHQDVNAHFAAVTRPGDRVLCMLAVPTRAGAEAILTAMAATARSAPRSGTPAETDDRSPR